MFHIGLIYLLCTIQDLNLWPSPRQGDALPTELTVHILKTKNISKIKRHEPLNIIYQNSIIVPKLKNFSKIKPTYNLTLSTKTA